MHDEEERLPYLLIACVVGLVTLYSCAIHCLPREISLFLISWAMLSLSVAITFGHCVLSER